MLFADLIPDFGVMMIVLALGIFGLKKIFSSTPQAMKDAAKERGIDIIKTFLKK